MSKKPLAQGLNETSPSVQTHLGIIQGVIQRMAANSSSCKAWCITIVSAILVVVADKGKPEYAFLALIPTLLFMALDAYYLALEKGFVESYNKFVEKVHSGSLNAEDLYSVAPTGKASLRQCKALGSFAVWPFYVVLAILTLIAKHSVLA